MFDNFVVIEYCSQFLSDQITMELLLYSHLPAALFALIVSTFVLYKSRTIPALFLFLSCLSFSFWCIFDLGAWFAFMGTHSSMFTWSLLDFTAVLMFVFAYYFLFTFTTNSDLPLWQKIVSFFLVLPVAIFSITGLNIPVFDLNSCAALEDRTFTIFTYYAEALIIIAAIFFVILHYRRSDARNEKRKTLVTGLGVLIFLLFFFSASFSVSLLAATDLSTYVYNYLIYGLFGMPIFLVFLGYLVVRYHAFNLKIFGSQALVFGLIALASAQYFFASSLAVTVLVTATLILTCLGGYFLVQSVRREISQKEQIVKLADNLKIANEKLKIIDKMKSEFVSIASHQLRSPLTSIAGYASLLREGNYGVVPNKMLEPLDRIEQSARFMAESIEDYLNVSRIESGNMKYHLSDFNLRETAERICDDVRTEALRKGLVLLFRTNMTKTGIVNADEGKIQQILHNLINNALKYTPKGSINVVVRDEPRGKRIFVDIVDTGIGMDDRTLHSIFQKFERGDKANTVNVKGTGLGLYVALRMAEAMGGTITAHSDGDSKGSRFTLELPLVM